MIKYRNWISRKLEVSVVSPLIYQCHHTLGFGATCYKSKVTPQKPKSWYHSLFYHDNTKLITKKYEKSVFSMNIYQIRIWMVAMCHDNKDSEKNYTLFQKKQYHLLIHWRGYCNFSFVQKSSKTNLEWYISAIGVEYLEYNYTYPKMSRKPLYVYMSVSVWIFSILL